MPILLDNNGVKRFVSNDRAAEALSQGWSLLPEESYDIVTKDGLVKTVKGDDQEKLAQAVGFESDEVIRGREAETERKQQLTSEYDNLGDEALAVGEGILSGLSFGLYEPNQDRAEVNPTAAGIGEVAGLVGPAFIPGIGLGKGIFGLGKAAAGAKQASLLAKGVGLTPAGMAVRAGRAVEAKIVGKVAEATVKRKLAGATIGAASEGAIFGGVPNAVEELKSDDWTAESVASALGTGALFGGVIGGAVGGAASGVSQAIGGILGKARKAANRLGNKPAGVLDASTEAAISADTSALNNSIARNNDLWDELEFLKTEKKLKTTSTSFNPESGAWEAAKGTVRITDEQANNLSSLLNDVQKSSDDIIEAAQQDAKHGNKFLEGLYRYGGDNLEQPRWLPVTRDTVEELGKMDVKSLTKTIRNIENHFDAQNALTTYLNKVKGELNIEGLAPVQKIKLDRFKNIITERGDLIDKTSIGLPEMIAGIGLVTDLDEVSPTAFNLLNLYVLYKYGKRSAIDTTLGRLGAGRSKSGIVGQLLGKSASITTKLDDGINAFLNKGVRRVAVPTANEIYKKISFSPEEKGTAASVPAANLYKGIERVRAEVHKAYSQKEQTAAQLRRNLGVVRAVNPALADQMEASALRGLDLAYQTMPRDPAIGNQLQGKSRWRPSDAATHKWVQTLAIVDDPTVAIELLQAGKLTKTHVEALQQVAPEMYSRMVRELTLRASSSENSLSYEQRAQLSILFGSPIDSSFRPEYVQRLQAQYLQTEEQQAQQAPSGNVNQSFSNSVATPSQLRGMNGKS